MREKEKKYKDDIFKGGKKYDDQTSKRKKQKFSSVNVCCQTNRIFSYVVCATTGMQSYRELYFIYCSIYSIDFDFEKKNND